MARRLLLPGTKCRWSLSVFAAECGAASSGPYPVRLGDTARDARIRSALHSRRRKAARSSPPAGRNSAVFLPYLRLAGRKRSSPIARHRNGGGQHGCALSEPGFGPMIGSRRAIRAGAANSYKQISVRSGYDKTIILLNNHYNDENKYKLMSFIIGFTLVFVC